MKTIGQISTHVIDTGSGLPAAGLRVRLEYQETGQWEIWAEALSDDAGRVTGLVGPDRLLRAGIYRLVFDTALYFRQQRSDCFFCEVQSVFEVCQPDQHYHIPLLLGPHSYTIYRGR